MSLSDAIWWWCDDNEPVLWTLALPVFLVIKGGQWPILWFFPVFWRTKNRISWLYQKTCRAQTGKFTFPGASCLKIYQNVKLTSKRMWIIQIGTCSKNLLFIRRWDTQWFGPRSWSKRLRKQRIYSVKNVQLSSRKRVRQSAENGFQRRWPNSK